MRLPVSALPSSYLAALLADWWLDDCGRDAIGWLLAEPKPNWQDARRLLTIAAGTVAIAPAAKTRRRGPGAVLASCGTNTGSFVTVQRWHMLVVGQNALAPVARVMAVKPPTPRMQASCGGKMQAEQLLDSSMRRAAKGVGLQLALASRAASLRGAPKAQGVLHIQPVA